MPNQKLINEFSNHYYFDQGGRTWKSIKWHGHFIYKYPTDLFIYQEIIFNTRPDLIIECGTCEGGTTLFMAHMLDLIGKGNVLTIDLVEKPNLPSHSRITYVKNTSSTDPQMIRDAYEIVERFHSRVMVVLDSAHNKEHVLQELEAYGPLVTPGCYMICEDTNIGQSIANINGQPGPYEAVCEFLPKHPEFVVDLDQERLLLTANPSGFLKRL